jgi:hypothetical protein
MKVTIEMTDELVDIDGVLCRIWTGHEENGVPVRVYVHRLAVPLELPQERFKRELVAMEPPAAEEQLDLTELLPDEPATDG